MRRFEQLNGLLKRVAGVILASVLAILAPVAGARQPAQDQQAPPTLGDVAKRLRAEKQQTPPAKKVWTNDNLPTKPVGVSVVGQQPPEEKAAAAADEAKTDAKATPGPEKPKTLSEMESELTRDLDELVLKGKELDLAKRDFALQQQAFYANAFANQDTAGQAQLAEVQAQLDAMQQDIDKKKARVAELQAQVDTLKKPAPAPGEGPGTPPAAL
jgi:hypothetical protein